nr:TlpA disulfide reductase family protein [uncultured Chryseobacterium sp.]
MKLFQNQNGKKIILFSLFLFGVLFYKANNFHIKASIKNIKKAQPVLYIYDNSGRKEITPTSTVNETYIFEGTINQDVSYAYIQIPTENPLELREIEFFVEADKNIEIVADSNHLNLAQIEGGIDNDRYRELEKRIKLLQSDKKEHSDEYEKIKTLRINYIKKNPALFSSLYNLLILSSQNNSIDEKELKNLYQILTSKYKNTPFGKKIQNKLDASESTQKGAYAPIFSALTINNEHFNLSDQKGKYIVLEFWGSWCIPCRKEHPTMIKLYNAYQSKGLEIIGIGNENAAYEEGVKKLEKAVEKDGVPWIQILSNKEKNQDISGMYGIIRYSTKFLIDREGKIVKSYVGEEEDLEQDLTMIFDNEK